jgi:DNA-binding CsgD family transcriptional regulator
MPRRNRAWSCRCSRNALGWASACGATGASGPVLGGDRSRGIKRKRCGRGGCVAEHWCPVVPQGWRYAASRSRAGVGRYLSFSEREEIAVLLAGGSGVREIARRLGRAPSTISRELQRNAAIGRGRVEYRASTAQRHAERRAQRPKPAKLAVNAQLRAYVQARLSGTVQRPDGSVAGPDIAWRGRRQGPRKDRRWGQCWSPEQISGRLRVDFPDDESMRVSHEAIYQSL